MNYSIDRKALKASEKISPAERVISNYLITFFVFCLPFSHAPTFFGPFFSLPFISANLIILNFVTFSVVRRGRTLTKAELGLAFLVLLYIAYLLAISFFTINGRTLIYLISYAWLPVAMFVFFFYSRHLEISLKPIVKALVFGLILCFLYNIYEVYLNLTGQVDSLIPRYDRAEYRFFSPFGFRVRGFNYESANYALYINLVFVFLFQNSSSRVTKYKLLTFWLFFLIAAFSSFHLIFFFFVILPLLLVKEIKALSGLDSLKLTLSISLVGVILVGVFWEQINYAVQIAIGKASAYIGAAGFESGEMRYKLMSQAIDLIKDAPVFGKGLASFYQYQDTGFNNFYLQLMQQVGVIGLTLFLMIMILIFLMSGKIRIFSVIVFLLTLLSLWFTADFWLPQILFAYLIMSQKRFKLNES